MVRPAEFEIKQRAEGSDVMLSLYGELDMRTIEHLNDCVARHLDSGAQNVTLDLRELAFMDSSGLRLLIELYDRARLEGWRLGLVCPEQEAALLVIRSTGADKALPFIGADEP
jgi:anti-anti-sigma factor